MLNFTVCDNFTEDLARKLATASTRAEHAVATQAAKDTAPFVPFLTGSLNIRTIVDGGTIIYPGPYARYLYYGKVMVDSATGEGPMRIVGKDGTEVIRFRKGATLRPINRDLDIKKRPGHAQAQSHWFEASKAQNLDKWIRKAQKAIINELK